MLLIPQGKNKSKINTSNNICDFALFNFLSLNTLTLNPNISIPKKKSRFVDQPYYIYVNSMKIQLLGSIKYFFLFVFS